MVGGTQTLLELLDLPRIDGAPQRKAGHAHDAVHRCAQFMAHVGEEHALGPVRRIGRVARRRQFRRAREHEFLEVMAVLLEFPVGSLLPGNVVADAQDADRPAFLVQNRAVGPVNKYPSSVSRHVLVFVFRMAFRVVHNRGEHLRQVTTRFGLVRRHDGPHHVPPQDLVHRIAKEPFSKFVEVGHRAIQIHPQYDRIRVCHQFPVFRFAGFQLEAAPGQAVGEA